MAASSKGSKGRVVTRKNMRSHQRQGSRSDRGGLAEGVTPDFTAGTANGGLQRGKQCDGFCCVVNVPDECLASSFRQCDVENEIFDAGVSELLPSPHLRMRFESGIYHSPIRRDVRAPSPALSGV